MPIYIYECKTCGEFEEHQSMSAPVLERCPTCEGPVKRAVPKGTSFVMKGGASDQSRCDRSRPCCGRETPCDKPPCGD